MFGTSILNKITIYIESKYRNIVRSLAIPMQFIKCSFLVYGYTCYKSVINRYRPNTLVELVYLSFSHWVARLRVHPLVMIPSAQYPSSPDPYLVPSQVPAAVQGASRCAAGA
jgi:hypothetical protein